MPFAPVNPLKLPRASLVDKTRWIIGKIDGKRVLHTGAADSPITAAKAASGRLLHRSLQGCCRELVGIDVDADSVALLREQYGIRDIVVGDIEALDRSFPLGSFDVVLAGDIIEHISNLGAFMTSVRKVLVPDGSLLITTPNAFSIKRFLGVILLRQERNHPDHLYYFSLMNLQQAAWRFGFEIVDTATFMYENPARRENRIGNRISRVLMTIARNTFLADELAVELRMVDDPARA